MNADEIPFHICVICAYIRNHQLHALGIVQHLRELFSCAECVLLDPNQTPSNASYKYQA